MNIYIIDSQQLVISITAKEARRYLADLKQDSGYLDANIKELRKVNKIELSSFNVSKELVYNNIGEPLISYLDTKIDIETEHFELDYWTEN
jgi:hypothetical protein